MLKRFLVSVADVTAMQGNDVIFTAKTLLNSSISVDLQSDEISGGQGNALQAVYFHSPRLNLTLEDTQFRLEYIALNAGSTITQSGDIWTNEEVILSGTTGTIVGTPVSIDGEAAVYVEYNGTHYTLPVAGSTFSVSNTDIPANSTLCVSYMSTNAAARTLVIPANVIPSRVRLYLTANLYGDTTGQGNVGKIQIEIPVAQLTGAQEISMTADGHSTTPLNAMALAYTDSDIVGCSNNAIYARMVELIYNTNWYDGISGIAIEGGDFGLVEGQTATLRVWAIKGGTSFLVDNANLTFTSSEGTVASVGTNSGLVSALTEGTSLIGVKITAKPTIEASATVTVSPAGD